ncbi:hypothetical protein FRC12_025052 [Ceratobasidium sp. 428]|nr:hypothetical protein FRC12_025052 [Ceratobasidium sp. 428]
MTETASIPELGSHPILVITGTNLCSGLQLNAQAGLLSSSAGAWSADEHVPVHAKIFSVGLYTILELRASVDGSDYFRSGGAFGLGVGYLNFDADMVLHDERTFDSLRGSVSRFWFLASTSTNGQPVGQIKFYDKNRSVSASVLAAFGFGIAAAVGFKGDFELKKI